MRVELPKMAEPGRAPKTLPEIMAAYERVILIQALQLNGFSRKRTAMSLGISKTCLWRHMTALKMDFSAIPGYKTGRPRKRREES